MVLQTWQVLTGALLAYGISKLFLKSLRVWHQWRMFHRCPGERDYSYIYGNIHKMPGPNEAGFDYLYRNLKEFPRLSRFWAGPLQPVITVQHPETAKLILKSSEPKPLTKHLSLSYEMGLPWLGEGLLLASGGRWERNRRLLTPAFHQSVLRTYMDVYNQSADVLLGKLQLHSESDVSVECFEMVRLCTLDILLQCAFSYRSNCQTEDSNPYVQAVKDIVALWSKRTYNRNFLFHVNFIYYLTSDGRKFLSLCKYVHGVAEDIIRKRKHELDKRKPESETKSKGKMDFLDILLCSKDAQGQGLSFKDIRCEVDTFLFAGHDTTTSAISWLLFHLAKYPDHQSRVQAEVDALLAGKTDDNIQWEDLPKLEYLTLCIKESLRLCTPIPDIGRKLTKETTIDGWRFPVGTTVFVRIMDMCRNPVIWENPLEFNPERFRTESTSQLDPFAYVPFSAGPRNCIGQQFALNEIKVVVSKILYRFDLTLDPDHVPRRLKQIVMASENGIKIKFTKR